MPLLWAFCGVSSVPGTVCCLPAVKVCAVAAVCWRTWRQEGAHVAHLSAGRCSQLDSGQKPHLGGVPARPRKGWAMALVTFSPIIQQVRWLLHQAPEPYSEAGCKQPLPCLPAFQLQELPRASRGKKPPRLSHRGQVAAAREAGSQHWRTESPSGPEDSEALRLRNPAGRTMKCRNRWGAWRS